MAAIIKLFTANIGTIAVLLVLFAVLALIAVRIIRNKKKGVSSCGCGCSTCPYSGKCHAQANNSSEQ